MGLGKFVEAVLAVRTANARYRMTAAIALDSVGKTEQAFALFDPARAHRESDADLLGAAIHIGLKLRRHPETLSFATALAGLQTDNQQLAELVRQLQAASQNGK